MELSSNLPANSHPGQKELKDLNNHLLKSPGKFLPMKSLYRPSGTARTSWLYLSEKPYRGQFASRWKMVEKENSRKKPAPMGSELKTSWLVCQRCELLYNHYLFPSQLIKPSSCMVWASCFKIFASAGIKSFTLSGAPETPTKESLTVSTL